MAGTTAFDTLATFRSLKAAGLEDAPAEAIAEAQAKAVRGAVMESVATKMDIADLKADHGRLEGKIDGVNTGISVIKWCLIGVMVPIVLALFGGVGTVGAFLAGVF